MPWLSAAVLVAASLASNDEPAAFVSKIPAPPKSASAAWARCKGGTDSAIEPLQREVEAQFQKLNQQLATQVTGGARRQDPRLLQEVSQVTLSANTAMQPSATQMQSELDTLDQKMRDIESQRLNAIDACPVVKAEATGPEAGCEKAANDAAKKRKLSAIDGYLADAARNFASGAEAAKKSLAAMTATLAKAGSSPSTAGLTSMRWQLVTQVLALSLNPCTHAADAYPADAP